MTPPRAAPRPLVVVCENRPKVEPCVEALRALGVEAEAIQVAVPQEPFPDPRGVAARAAGLVLCGGPDVEPWRYGEEPRPDARLALMPELDRLEWELLQGAADGRTPVWAICRGMQTVNVFQGGTLWQDIPTQVDEALDHHVGEPLDALAHDIEVVDRRDSFGDILGRDRAEVNSRHHQAIRDPGRQVTVVARSSDGLAEVMVLDREDWWVKGVQWHPENLVGLAVQRRLWLEFLDAAGYAAAMP